MRRKIVIVISAIIISLIALYFIPSKPDDVNGYKSFEQLDKIETIGEDYTIHVEDTDSTVLLMAIHGGGIEPGTTELTEYIASENGYSYYTFNGIKEKGNFKMHITSTDFDEPKLLEKVSDSTLTLSIHGYDDENKNTYIGGLDAELIKKLKTELTHAGFSVSKPPKKLAGKEKDNITNKNNDKKGVQIEISTAQREAFFKNNSLLSKNRKSKKAEFYEYANAIEKALND